MGVCLLDHCWQRACGRVVTTDTGAWRGEAKPWRPSSASSSPPAGPSREPEMLPLATPSEAAQSFSMTISALGRLTQPTGTAWPLVGVVEETNSTCGLLNRKMHL